MGEPVTLSPPEWNLVIRIDGRKTRRGARPRHELELVRDGQGPLRPGDGDLVEMRPRDATPRRRPWRPRRRRLRARRPASSAAARAGTAPARPARRSRRPRRVLGDEKKILMILCTRVKQEAEVAIGEANLPGHRPPLQAGARRDRPRPRRRGRARPDPADREGDLVDPRPGDHEGLPGQDVAGDAAEGLSSRPAAAPAEGELSRAAARRTRSARREPARRRRLQLAQSRTPKAPVRKDTPLPKQKMFGNSTDLAYSIRQLRSPSEFERRHA